VGSDVKELEDEYGEAVISVQEQENEEEEDEQEVSWPTAPCKSSGGRCWTPWGGKKCCCHSGWFYNVNLPGKCMKDMRRGRALAQTVRTDEVGSDGKEMEGEYGWTVVSVEEQENEEEDDEQEEGWPTAPCKSSGGRCWTPWGGKKCCCHSGWFYNVNLPGKCMKDMRRGRALAQTVKNDEVGSDGKEMEDDYGEIVISVQEQENENEEEEDVQEVGWPTAPCKSSGGRCWTPWGGKKCCCHSGWFYNVHLPGKCMKDMRRALAQTVENDEVKEEEEDEQVENDEVGSDGNEVEDDYGQEQKNGKWVLASAGASCKSACSSAGRTCNANAQLDHVKLLDTRKGRMRAAMNEWKKVESAVGVRCSYALRQSMQSGIGSSWDGPSWEEKTCPPVGHWGDNGVRKCGQCYYGAYSNYPGYSDCDSSGGRKQRACWCS